MRKKFIAGNWKMHKGGKEAIEIAKNVKEGIQDDKVDVMIAPPFTAIPDVGRTLEGGFVKLGAQNMHFEEQGAFTGEISPFFLLDFGVKFVILGHSERRKIFGEVDDLIAKKTAAALTFNLTPIVCVGETLSEREEGKTFDVIERELNTIIPLIDKKKIVFAYEPIWAIGTGKVATPETAVEVHKFIRGKLGDIGQDIRILYGGSVKPENAESLLKEEEIDGALVGGASLNPESFLSIISTARSV